MGKDKRVWETTALKGRVEVKDQQKRHKKGECIQEGKGKVCEFFKSQFLYLKSRNIFNLYNHWVERGFNTNRTVSMILIV